MSADSVRVALPLFHAGRGGSTPTSALQLRFYRTDKQVFRDLNMLWHSRLPKICGSFGRAYYVAEFDGLFYATAMWSNPVARLLPQQTWLELRRFAIADDAPKNTASRMLGWMVRDIRRRLPQIETLLSYQDCDVHEGTIYKAVGWYQGNVDKRARTWTWRANRTNQAVAPRIRWQKDISGGKTDAQ